MLIKSRVHGQGIIPQGLDRVAHQHTLLCSWLTLPCDFDIPVVLAGFGTFLSGHHSHTQCPEHHLALTGGLLSTGNVLQPGPSDDGPNRPVSEVNFSSSCSGLAIRTLAWPGPRELSSVGGEDQVWWTPDPEHSQGALHRVFLDATFSPYFERRCVTGAEPGRTAFGPEQESPLWPNLSLKPKSACCFGFLSNCEYFLPQYLGRHIEESF